MTTETREPSRATDAGSEVGALFVAANQARRRQEASGGALADFTAKQKRHDAQQAKVLPNFDDMLGTHPPPLVRVRHTDGATRLFYPVPPKLSALSTLMAGVQAVGFGEIGEALLILQLASTYLYTEDEEPGRKRRATSEEIEEFLGLDDLELLKALNEKYLNAVMGTPSESKNA